MQEKSNTNFFKFLLDQKLKIPVLETGIIIGENIEYLISNDETGFIRRKNPKSLKILSYFNQVCTEASIKSQLLPSPLNKICYIYKKGERKVYDNQKVKEILLKNPKFSNFELIQKCLPCEEKIFLAKLSYLTNKYETNFTYGKNILCDQIAISYMIDILTIIISCIEKSEYKRVVQINLEFIKDDHNNLLLMNCTKCLLIEAKFTIGHEISNSSDLENFVKNMSKKFPDLKKNKSTHSFSKVCNNDSNIQNLNESHYVFKRGQLRNKNSNLDSPIRIYSPQSISEKEDSERLANEKNKTNKSKNFLFQSLQAKIPSLIKSINVKNPKVSVNDLIKKFIKEKNKSNEKVLKKTESLKKNEQSYKRAERNSIFCEKNNEKYEKVLKSEKSLKSEKTISEPTLKFFSQRKKFLSNLKCNGKIQNGHPSSVDESRFMELVVKTYFRRQSFGKKLKNSEIGLDNSLSPRAYSKYLAIINQTEKETEIFNEKTSHLLIKPVLEEIMLSRPSSPEHNTGKSQNLPNLDHQNSEKNVKSFVIKKKKTFRSKHDLSLMLKQKLTRQVLNTTRY